MQLKAGGGEIFPSFAFLCLHYLLNIFGSNFYAVPVSTLP